MFGPIITVMPAATSKPVLVLFSPQSHPAVPERDRSGKRQQSASSSKTSLATECIYSWFTYFWLMLLLKSSIAESLTKSPCNLLHIKWLQWGGIDLPPLVGRDKVHGIGEFKRTRLMLMGVRIYVEWRAPTLLATGCICLFSKQPHHRPDFCLNRKQSVVQWKGPGSKRRLNPVWFGDKLKSTEGKIKGKEWKRAELPAISLNYFMTLLLRHLAKLHNNSKPLWSGLIVCLKHAVAVMTDCSRSSNA